MYSYKLLERVLMDHCNPDDNDNPVELKKPKLNLIHFKILLQVTAGTKDKVIRFRSWKRIVMRKIKKNNLLT